MKIITTILFILSSIITFAQDGAMADLKFEEAETAFNNQDYETTIKKLDEFDKLLGSIKDKSLYLRIISQDKLFEKLFYIAKIGVQIKNHKEGILVTNIVENSAAFKSGLEENDIILKLNELKISNYLEFIENIKYKNEGDKIYIQLLRGEELIDKTLFVELSKDVKDENKIYFDDKNFDFLTKFRKNTNAYIKAMESSGLDERYREIYTINAKLEKYPKDKVSWFKEKQKVIDKSTTIVEEENRNVKELENYYLTVASKIDSWEYDDLIKVGVNIKDLQKTHKKELKEKHYTYYSTDNLVTAYTFRFRNVNNHKIETSTEIFEDFLKIIKKEFGIEKVFLEILQLKLSDTYFDYYYCIDSPYSHFKIVLMITRIPMQTTSKIYKYPKTNQDIIYEQMKTMKNKEIQTGFY